MDGKGFGNRGMTGLALAAFVLAGSGCRAAPFAVTTEVRHHRLGQTALTFLLHASDPLPPDTPVFLVLHDDENTAVAAGLAALRARGGRLIEVRAQGERLVWFLRQGESWRFDPNRIFTPWGLEATLHEHNGRAPAEVAAEVGRFAQEILALPGAVPLLVTLHNNTDGDYSAASYLPGADLAGDAAAVHLPPGADADDFFFVTDPGLHDRLVAEGMPVVLQHTPCAEDDGSLSLWAGRAGVPYVNVETEHGHTGRQERMLEVLSRALERSR